MEPEDAFIPKHHMMLHLLRKSSFLGNPRHYATWEDESENRRLKAMCRHTSQATFENSVLTRFQLSETQKRKRLA